MRPGAYALTRRRHRWAVAALDAAGEIALCLRARPAPRREDVRSILLIRRERLGDLVLMEPAIARLRQLFPAARLTWLVAAEYAQFVEHTNLVDAVWAAPSRWRAFRAKPRGFDLAFDFHADPGAIAIARRHVRGGAGVVAGWPIRGGSFLLDTAPPFLWSEPAYLRRVRLVEAAAGVEAARVRPPQLALNPLWRAAGRAVALPESYVIVNPGCGQVSKHWPLPRWRAVVESCLRRGWPLVLTGSAADRAACAELAAGFPKSLRDLSGTTSLAELAGIVARAACVLAPDTGIVHLAQALGVPTLALFGPTDAEVWGYAGDRARRLAYPLPCAPCDRGACPRLPRELRPHAAAPCMEALATPLVLQELEAVMEGIRPAASALATAAPCGPDALPLKRPPASARSGHARSTAVRTRAAGA